MKNQQGFTLVELLITILVASILLATAVPAFNDFIQNNRITATSNELVTALAVARSEAIRRRGPVSLCSSANQATCANSANWGTGWIVFSDRNTVGTVDGTDRVLRVWGATPTGFTVTANNGAQFVAFDRLGAATPGEIFDLANPDCRTGQANRERRITLITSGSVGAVRRNCP